MKKLLITSTLTALCAFAYADDLYLLMPNGTGHSAWNMGNYWYSGNPTYTSYTDPDGNTYYELNQTAVGRIPNANDNVYFVDSVGDRYRNTTDYPTYVENGSITHFKNGTFVKDAEGNVDWDATKTNFNTAGNGLVKIFASYHNGGAAVNVKNWTIEFSKDFIFGNTDTVANSSEFRFHTISTAVDTNNNNITVSDTLNVGGDKKITFYITTQSGVEPTAKLWSFGRVNVDFNTAGQLFYIGQNEGSVAVIKNVQIGVEQVDDVTYKANSLAASEVSANSVLQFNGNTGTASSTYTSKGNVLESVTLGNFNNKGKITFQDVTSVATVSDAWIKQTFTSGEGESATTTKGIINIEGGTNIDNLNVDGGYVHINSADYTINSMTVKGGGEIVLNNKFNLSGNLTMNDGWLTTSGVTGNSSTKGFAVYMGEGSSMDITTDRFWLNSYCDISSHNYRWFYKGADVTMLGKYVFRGNGKCTGIFESTTKEAYEGGSNPNGWTNRALLGVAIGGNNITINELEFAGGFYANSDKSLGGTTTIDYGNWIDAYKLVANSIKIYGDKTFDGQYGKFNVGSAEIKNFHFLGGVTSDDARKTIQYRFSGNYDIENLYITGYFKNGHKLQFDNYTEANGTRTLHVDNFVAEAGFNMFENSGSTNQYLGTYFSADNFTVNLGAGKTNQNVDLVMLDVKGTNFSFDNNTSAARSANIVLQGVFEVENLKIGTDSASAMTVNTYNRVIVKNIASDKTVLGDVRGTFDFGTVEIGSKGAFNVGGWAKNEGDSNLIINSLKMTSGATLTLAHNNAGGADAENRTNYLATIATLSGNGGTIKTYDKFINATLSLGTSGTETSTFSGAIVDATNSVTNIVKTGSNTQILSGNNIIKGSVTVNEGTLLMYNDGVVASLNINGGNFGLVGGEVEVGALAYTAGKILVDVSTPTALMLESSAISGNITADTFSYSNIVEDSMLSLILFTDGNMSENLDGLLDGKYTYTDTVTGKEYLADYSFDMGSFNVTFSYIPEPSTYAVFAGLLALGLAIYRRRK